MRHPGMRLPRVRRWVKVVCVFLLIGLVATPVVADRNPSKRSKEIDPDLQRLLSRFDEVQTSVRSLSTDFTMVTTNPMLQEPVASTGQLFLTKPDSVRWEFTSPEEMAFVIANGEYIGYYPTRKKAERRDFHRWSEQVFRYFGLGQGSAELSRIYHISLDRSIAAPDGVQVLRLEPRKRRARKRVQEVLLWVDLGTYLPVRVEYGTKNGGTREIDFRNMQINPDLAASFYEVHLPPDVTVVHGADGLGATLQAAPGPSSH